MTVPSAPLTPHYGTLSGQLFLYASGRAAFESPLPASLKTTDEDYLLPPTQRNNNKCILLGGLSDGLLPVPYTAKLEHACIRSNWSLVQPIMSSSYLGFGHGSLQRDTDELNELIAYLVEHRNCDKISIVGHSTGCQNAIHYLKHGDPDYVSQLALIVLQAPVSDREHAMMSPDYTKHLETAQQMSQQGRGSEMMPREAFWAPITALRFLDLQEKGGADDLFSSDFTDEELEDRLGHVGRAPSSGSRNKKAVLVAFSGSDEYVPDHVDLKGLTDRMVNAMNTDSVVAEALYLPSANHNLSEGVGDNDKFIQRVEELLRNAVDKSNTS